jgi:hypothetical protein
MPRVEISNLGLSERFVNALQEQKVENRAAPRKKMLVCTFEAGMCMKTKEKIENCPAISRTFSAIERLLSAISYQAEASDPQNGVSHYMYENTAC